MQGKYKFLVLGALSAGCLAVASAYAADKEVIPGWQNADHNFKDAPLHDPMILYASGGVDGKLAVIGIPSFKTYRHIDCGVDTHEVVFSGSPAGNKNCTPDGQYAYLNDKGANTICEFNLQTGFLERIIALPFPFGVHHIALSKDGKYLFGTGEYTRSRSKPAPSSGAWPKGPSPAVMWLCVPSSRCPRTARSRSP